jgi:3',5'-cyclic-AMP phosphodiesterase
VVFDLTEGGPAALVLEPPAYQVHRYRAETGIVSHTVYVERYPGPFPFVLGPDYPGTA